MSEEGREEGNEKGREREREGEREGSEGNRTMNINGRKERYLHLIQYNTI